MLAHPDDPQALQEKQFRNILFEDRPIVLEQDGDQSIKTSQTLTVHSESMCEWIRFKREVQKTSQTDLLENQ